MSDTPPPPPPPDAVPPPPPPSLDAAMQTTAFVGMAGPLGKRRSPGLIVVLTLVTCGIWGLVWSFQTGDEVKQHTREGLGGVVYLIITFLLAPLTMFLLASEVENMYRREGKEPPITTIWGLWFLLPIIGNLIWYLRIQRALNDYWTDHGQTNPASV
jgi:hypothetical protein